MIRNQEIILFILIAILTAIIFIFFMIVIIIVFTKKQNRKEKEFLHLLIKDRERRNQRIDFELNKNIINPISASRFYLNEIEGNTNNEDQEGIKMVLNNLNLALDHIYHLDQCLNDYNIEKFGLYAAISEELDWINKTTDIKSELFIEGKSLDLPLFESLLLLRIIQEALLNSLNHANTNKIKIVFQFQPHSLNLYIQDFGIGFNPSLLQNHFGEGLKNIKQFCKQLKGELAIISNVMDGTKIQIDIPELSCFY